MTFDQLKKGISEISKPKFKQSAEEVNKRYSLAPSANL